MRMHASSPLTPLPAAQAPVMVNSVQAAQVLSSPGQANNGGGGGSAPNGSLNEEAERYCRNCDIR